MVWTRGHQHGAHGHQVACKDSMRHPQVTHAMSMLTVSGKILRVKHRSRLKKTTKASFRATYFLIKKKKAFLYGEVFNEAMMKIAKTMLKEGNYRL